MNRVADILGHGSRRRLRCALFVDFDNVYLGLLKLDPAAAEAFASDPATWLARLEDGKDDEGEFSRRFLVRACYLNPATFANYRPFFTRAGFRVVDCPSLTQQGKSAADINLVLDAVDALSSPTRYDEFVIVSADADFTPLALRCRAADRLVTVITAGPSASAYRAVADTVITADELAELVTPSILTSVADTAMTADALAELVRAPATLSPDEESPQADKPEAGTSPEPSTVHVLVADTPATTADAPDAVRRLLHSAEGLVKGTTVAAIAQQVDPSLPLSSWDGHGGFSEWLAALVPEAGYSSLPPGYVWDRNRFSENDLPAQETDALTPIQRQIARVTDTPGLTQEQYASLLTALADDLQVNQFNRTATSKHVRDVCQETGAGVSRASVNFVIQGLLYSGMKLDSQVTAPQLAAAWFSNVVGLCRGARMELDDADVDMIRSWVGGGLVSGS